MEGIKNFRRIRGTKCYRSGTVKHATRKDVDKMKELGIKKIIELQGNYTSDKDTNYLGLTYPAGIDHIFMDINNTFFERKTIGRSMLFRILLFLLKFLEKYLIPGIYQLFAVNHFVDGGLLEYNKALLENCPDEIVKVLHELSTLDGSPVLFCCAVGKDRTGLISMMLQCIVGLDKQAIAEDYQLSPTLDYKLLKLLINHSFLEAKYDTMMEILDFINMKYGSVKNFLRQNGFSLDDQEKVKKNFQSFE